MTFSYFDCTTAKKFESIYRGNLTDDFINKLLAKGEYVVLLTTAV